MLHVGDLMAGDWRTVGAVLNAILFAFVLVGVPAFLVVIVLAVLAFMRERPVSCRNERCRERLHGERGEHFGVCASCWAAGKRGAELATIVGFILAIPWLPWARWLKLFLVTLTR